MRRARVLTAGFAASALLLAACGDTEGGSAADLDLEPDANGSAEDGGEPEGEAEGGLLERAESEGITIAFANEVPYGYEGDDGQPTGQAPTVAMEVLDRMGITEVNATTVDFDGLIPGLNAGRFDMVAAGMWINADRVQEALFTDPDYCDTTAFAVPEGNPDGLTDYQSVIDADITLGVMGGAVQQDDAEDSGVTNLETYGTDTDLLDALAAGRIDAYALTNVTVQGQMDVTDGFEATEGFVPEVDGEERLGCGGFVFAPANLDFRDAFNEVVVEMRENGELLGLVEEFGFTQDDLDAASGLTVEDLAGIPYDTSAS